MRTMLCADSADVEFEYSLDYTGPAQVAFTDTDLAEQAWLPVVQPCAG